MVDDPATRDSVQPLTTTANVTQVALEQWASTTPPNANITQVALEHWRTVGYLVPTAAEMDGTSSLAAVGIRRISITAQMDGVASMAATGSLLRPGAAHMDGVASVSGDSQVVTYAAAHMDGHASVAAGGGTVINGIARMDGIGGMVAITEAGSAIAEMDGTSSMNVISYAPPVVPTQEYLYEITFIGTQPAVQVTYHLGLLQNMVPTPALKTLLQMKVRLTQNTLLISGYTWKWAPKLQEIIRLHLSSATHTNYNYVFTDNIGVRPTPIPFWNAIINLVQGLDISPTLNGKFIWGRVLKEILKISSVAGASATYQKSLAQLFKLTQAFQVGRIITLQQNINLSSSSFLALSMKLLEKALVASVALPKLNYHLTLAAQIVIEDIIGHYHFADMLLSEALNIHPTLDRQYIAIGSMAELLKISPAFTNKLILKIIGNIQLNPEQLVSMIYAGDELLDGVVIQALYISPSGTTTTWAVNTRTNAVTEYLNYDFNSFTVMGNRYIAAGADGLYELDGDTDDGAAIISELMSGYLQLNDKKLFGVKGAYVAIRGGGRFYLKLISGDGREYVYELRAQPNLMTTKVRIGKGINTTYVAFDLITEGQDFDLNSIEFIPMTRGRRV